MEIKIKQLKTKKQKIKKMKNEMKFKKKVK